MVKTEYRTATVSAQFMVELFKVLQPEEKVCNGNAEFCDRPSLMLAQSVLEGAKIESYRGFPLISPIERHITFVADCSKEEFGQLLQDAGLWAPK